MSTNNLKEKLASDELGNSLEKRIDQVVKAYMLRNFADQIQPVGDFIDQLESEIIKYALLVSEENQKKAAFLLGLKASTLCEKMKRFNIKLDNKVRNTALPFLRSIEEIGKLVTHGNEPVDPD